MVIDSHAHLTDSTVFAQIEEVLERAKNQGIQKIVNICTDALTLKRGVELAKKHAWVFNAAASTPHDVQTEGEHFFPIVQKAIEAKQLIAIGETGLDYYYEHAAPEIQRQFLLRYFELAKASSLPLIIHCREAFEDLFKLADMGYQDAPLLLHCFTGTQKEARSAVERGWFISFSGIITFKKSEALRDVLKIVPLERILVETDAPFLSPQTKRGKMCEPSFIVETVATIAQIKGISQKEAEKITTANAETFFSFSKLS
jgi:TatD DNase family protein